MCEKSYYGFHFRLVVQILSLTHRVWGQKFHIDLDPQGRRHTRLVEPKLKAFGMKTLARESCPKHDAQPVPRMPRSYSPSEPSAEPGLHNSSFIGPSVLKVTSLQVFRLLRDVNCTTKIQACQNCQELELPLETVLHLVLADRIYEGNSNFTGGT